MTHHHGLQPLKGLSEHCQSPNHPISEDRFGRLFPDLPGAYTDPGVLEGLGAAGGPMDSGGNAVRTHSVPAGMVIFGQFIDHDITLDTESSFDRVNQAASTENTRSPTLDLDSVYGAGPEVQPYLYRQGAQSDPFLNAKLVTGADSAGGDPLSADDLARVASGAATIGDPRNDENRIISQMQLAFIRFHNQQCEALHAENPELVHESLLEAARQSVVWHYQWAVVNEFLPLMCGDPVVADILAHGRRFYRWGIPYIPVEFAVAAYRFGHSMVPMTIQTQKGGTAFEFFGSVLGGGFSPLADQRAIVDWHELFDTPEGRQVQRADRLNTSMAPELLELPFVPADGVRSLATRNLLRGNSFRLPAAEAVAQAMERPESEIEHVMDRVRERSNDAITAGVPLWFYVLMEAEVIGRGRYGGQADAGEGLGPVGARIVAEVLIGLIELDPRSYLGSNRNWRPDPAHDGVGKMLASVNSSAL